jgi:hypothetical protein
MTFLYISAILACSTVDFPALTAASPPTPIDERLFHAPVLPPDERPERPPRPTATPAQPHNTHAQNKQGQDVSDQSLISLILHISLLSLKCYLYSVQRTHRSRWRPFPLRTAGATSPLLDSGDGAHCPGPSNSPLPCNYFNVVRLNHTTTYDVVTVSRSGRHNTRPQISFPWFPTVASGSGRAVM